MLDAGCKEIKDRVSGIKDQGSRIKHQASSIQQEKSPAFQLGDFLL
jgi:hypothetical protein